MQIISTPTVLMDLILQRLDPFSARLLPIALVETETRRKELDIAVPISTLPRLENCVKQPPVLESYEMVQEQRNLVLLGRMPTRILVLKTRKQAVKEQPNLVW